MQIEKELMDFVEREKKRSPRASQKSLRCAEFIKRTARAARPCEERKKTRTFEVKKKGFCLDDQANGTTSWRKKWLRNAHRSAPGDRSLSPGGRRRGNVNDAKKKLEKIDALKRGPGSCERAKKDAESVRVSKEGLPPGRKKKKEKL